jgi:hypothetical protein
MQQSSQVWKSKLALLLALGLGVVPTLPLLTATGASAQIFRNSPSDSRDSRDSRDYGSRTFRIAEGTYIPAEYEDSSTRRIAVAPGERLDLTLVTTRDVLTTRGTVVIPEGSRIRGQIEPDGDGVRFVAESLELRNGDRERLNATSDLITRRERADARDSNGDSIWQGALVGGAAATITSVTDVGFAKTALGAGVGALAGWLIDRDKSRRDNREVFLIDPRRDLALTVEEDLLISLNRSDYFNDRNSNDRDYDYSDDRDYDYSNDRDDDYSNDRLFDR